MPLLVCAALLCGCGGGEKTLAVQEQYRTVRTADMEAEVVSHTDTDDRRFVLTCQYDTEGQSITTVKEPQELKGLTAVLVDGQLSLKSNGQLLPAGAATDICPANCLPYLLRRAGGGVSDWSRGRRRWRMCRVCAWRWTPPGTAARRCSAPCGWIRRR